MKKILVVGEYYSENLGDGIICENVKYLLENSFPEADIKISDIMGRLRFEEESSEQSLIIKTSSSKREDIKKYLINKNGQGLGYLYDRLTYKKWKKERETGLANIRRTLEEDFDLVVFAGGQLLYEPFLIPIEQHMEILNNKNTPVIFNGCGIGSFTNKYIQERFNKMMQSKIVKSVTVRDYVAEANEKLLGSSPVKAVKTDDSALWTSKAYQMTEVKASDTIGLGIIFRNNIDFMAKQERLYSQIISQLEENGQDWEIFCNGEVIDQEFAYQLVEKNGYSKEKVATRKVRPHELVELIGSYKAIISFRLHSHIVATSLRVPSIGMTWDKKVNFFFGSFNAEDRCFSVDSNSTEIISKLNEAMGKPLDGEILNKYQLNLKKLLITEVEQILSQD